MIGLLFASVGVCNVHACWEVAEALAAPGRHLSHQFQSNQPDLCRALHKQCFSCVEASAEYIACLLEILETVHITDIHRMDTQ